ncbi:ParB/RepB/Spo0J family partition protein [Flavobacteriaceae bacterium]|jgi:ParB family transcriptional regulator, chromosome partitioning protein|nr:ParB/RepB/Spo0J family partition protein [Flavobacteriaceae bacterium]MDB4134989.1 ParB/RepB/Spo0J family partition protein [Flavobacteriaceae bacterium]MDB4196166.1 ParB/RepB/Spo0J family partition protein [Flavobacteriaceae bacterium]
MANKKQVLGRGLSAMLGSKEMETIKSSTNEININEISVNPFQPRSNFNNSSLQELSISIKNIGIIQPITVRKIDNNKYQLISGERRLRACKEIGLKKIPAYVREANDQDSLEMALVENIHRQDLDAIEIAISYQRLIEEINLTQEELSDKIGKNRTTISNYLRLLKLDPIIQSGIRDGFITMGHGRALINISLNKDQLNIYKKIISKNLSVRNTELLVRDLKGKPSKVTSKIKEKFKSSLLDTDVFINKGKNGKGNFVVNFDNKIEFDRINKLLNDKQ